MINNNDINVKIVDYEGWSLNNTSNKLSHLYFNKGNNILIFVSNKEINEMELFGLRSLLKRWSSHFTGTDVKTFIANSRYDNINDYIYPQFNLGLTKYDGLIFPIIKNASDKYLDYLFDKKTSMSLLEKAKSIIYICSFVSTRYDKTLWWKIKNPRICEVIDNMEYL